MVKLALLWHMHQPYYEDLATGEHILPWVRLHATKDYWGMVALTREFPTLRVSFNLVPSLLVQLDAFAEDRANDRHLLVGLKPADHLSADEQEFLVANGFHAPVERAIRPNARYAELYDKRVRRAPFTVDDLRDLQVWHKLVWMDPDWLLSDARLRSLTAKGRSFSESDKQVLREVELELLRAVIPAHKSALATGQVELTTSPFYHPILPLLCDTDTHFRAHPHSALPKGVFAFPDDAHEQMARALDYHARTFGTRPQGVWPSEGAVSDEVIDMLANHGVAWTATDEEILARSLGRRLTAADLYRPYEAGTGPRKTRVLFRDHELSDLIGFAYQSWSADAAVTDFLSKVRERGRRFNAETSGEEAVISVVLDGENAWEHYPEGGRPFLRALYQQLQDASDIRTVTMSEAAQASARALPSIFPGSWINGDFYIWAGHRDDHRAWRQLAEARRVFAARKDQVVPESRNRALEELFIAEGSDWFWWYGDDHSSDHDREFDELFRRHLRNVYRALGESTPDDLHLTNITTVAVTSNVIALGILTTPVLDGRSTDFTQWAAAVNVPLGGGGGTMHRVAGQLVRGLEVTADARNLYLRLTGSELVHRLTAGAIDLVIFQDRPHAVKAPLRWVAVDVVTAAVPFDRLGVRGGDRVSLSVLIVDAAGHVIEQHPAMHPFEVDVPDAFHDATHWLV